MHRQEEWKTQKRSVEEVAHSEKMQNVTGAPRRKRVRKLVKTMFEEKIVKNFPK